MPDQGEEGFLSPFLRKKRIAASLPFLRGKILDVGCGSGELARHVKPENYVGFDPDIEIIAVARAKYISYRFETSLSLVDTDFDTIVALAVIEHVSDPIGFLKALKTFLRATPESRIILTTPHPSFNWAYNIGARFGIFSAHANEEHEGLLDRNKLFTAAKYAGLRMSAYRRILFGANQIAFLY